MANRSDMQPFRTFAPDFHGLRFSSPQKTHRHDLARRRKCFVFPLDLTEQRLVLSDVIHHPEWLLAGELFHHIVRAGKESVAAILGDGSYVLEVVSGRP